MDIGSSAKERRILYIRNLIFGAEDSLVSTVGLLSGVAIGGEGSASIVLTGIVLIFVEAFSMGVGSYLSESSVSESIQPQEKGTIQAAVIMFGAYLISGLVPLLPYVFWREQVAFYTSILASIIGLFILGLFSARMLKIRIWRNAYRMAAIGGAAILIGTAVGKIVGR